MFGGIALQLLFATFVSSQEYNYEVNFGGGAEGAKYDKLIELKDEEIQTESLRSRRNTDYDKSYQDFLAKNFPAEEKAKKLIKHEDAETYEPEVREIGYKFNNDDEYERIKNLSQKQAKEIKKNPKNCKIVKKDKMECTICFDPKTSSKSESCSYDSEPSSKQYAYVREKNYNSKDDDDKDVENVDASVEEVVTKKPKKQNHKSESISAHPAQTKKSKRPIKRGVSSKTSERRPQRNADSDNYKFDDEDTYEKYYSRAFPKENKKENLKEYETLPGYSSRNSDVDVVLAEFKKKDRTSCKKTIKGNQTCYKCKEQDGSNYEECMFVSDTTPKKNRYVYENSDDQSKEGSEIVEEKAEVPTENKLKKKIVIKKRKVVKSDDKPKEENSSEEKRTFKRTVSYKVEGNDGVNPDGLKTVEYEHSIVHSS